MNDLVSIIVPIYKVEKYLNRCANSLINQTYKKVEIILVDDGSPDNCPAICDEWAAKDKRIKVIHKQNGGVSSARNAGLAAANGDFICFVDSDDYVDNDYIEKLLNKQKEKDADLVFCYFKRVYDNKTLLVQECAIKRLCENNDISCFISTENPIVSDEKTIFNNSVMMCTWRILFKTSAIKNIKFYEQVNRMEDALYILEIVKNKNLKLDYIEEYLYNYYIRESSITNSPTEIVQNNINYIDYTEKILSTEEYQEILSNLKFYCYSECIVGNLKTKSLTDEQKKIIKSWNTDKNYRARMKYTFGFKFKLKYFLIHHNLLFVLKLILKVK